MYIWVGLEMSGRCLVDVRPVYTFPGSHRSVHVEVNDEFVGKSYTAHQPVMNNKLHMYIYTRINNRYLMVLVIRMKWVSMYFLIHIFLQSIHTKVQVQIHETIVRTLSWTYCRRKWKSQNRNIIHYTNCLISLDYNKDQDKQIFGQS
jgi:hypothetical protein